MWGFEKMLLQIPQNIFDYLVSSVFIRSRITQPQKHNAGRFLLKNVTDCSKDMNKIWTPLFGIRFEFCTTDNKNSKMPACTMPAQKMFKLLLAWTTMTMRHSWSLLLQFIGIYGFTLWLPENMIWGNLLY